VEISGKPEFRRNSGAFSGFELQKGKQHMEHPKTEEFWSLKDGELSPDEARILEAHIEHCSICRAKFEEVTRTLALMGELEVPAPSPGFVRELRHEAEQRMGRFSRLPRWIPWSAAAAVLLAVGITFSGGPDPTLDAVETFTEDEVAIVSDLELLEDADLIAFLDDFDDEELFATLDDILAEAE
jgi:hypothetical protein